LLVLLCALCGEMCCYDAYYQSVNLSHRRGRRGPQRKSNTWG